MFIRNYKPSVSPPPSPQSPEKPSPATLFPNLSQCLGSRSDSTSAPPPPPPDVLFPASTAVDQHMMYSSVEAENTRDEGNTQKLDRKRRFHLQRQRVGIICKKGEAKEEVVAVITNF